MDTYVPFCGAPPMPAELWSRWTLDPYLLSGLALAGLAGFVLLKDKARFGLAWGLVGLLFVSPLCAASIALFSARVGQHILLTLVAAPILAAALPRMRLPALPCAILFAVLFWVWHAPGPYQATLESDLGYWSMHLSLFGSATLLFAAMRARPHMALGAAALTGAQLTVYASMLTLAPVAWHDWHLATTLNYGLTALADQQLAGALMWVAGGALFLTSIASLALRFFKETPSGPAPTQTR
ncbi:cytochrome c oxidase caa3 assembly factor (plasmid) [Dinoroseobacter shibae DFL 12 = DSM 16493]|jgi:putative membrane protein|uniref:Cytochrome c oxidase caa3 assembly factor n=2 Tax=Pseudomonadota TaxID=1224 RepID=A8LTQ0_DINSH|nr:cytochrome c oxidase assembly protein [Dinoroseobacter shibae]ABV95617.1 cytochrome c oxidase caa3 assembly factor [Dinoroseobacter shibae DFL 12 = DSM 16493]URF48825.1 cytochrome c oxidase assembly protein [Dinoroseobacter shibae]URF53137.1 cytochrome c oxidase assembly protein [Dinoroseobacter shibae]